MAVGNWGKIGDKTVGKTHGFILKPRFENKIAPPKRTDDVDFMIHKRRPETSYPDVFADNP